MDYRLGSVAALALGLWMANVPAQERPAQDAAGRDAEVAIEKWLASDHTSEELLEATVKAVLADPKGLRYLGERLTASASTPDAPRTKGCKGLATHTSLEFLRRQTASKVVYAGQYTPLLPLQPFVGELFFSLLVQTPDWYPDTHRIHLVPVLRDLQPQLPRASLLDGVMKIVENKAIEPEDLRTAIACMLWQWGKKDHVQPMIDRLQHDSAEGEAEDRVQVLLNLADLFYTLREYKTSAATHRALQSLAASAKFELKPVDYYSAACVNALAGDVERGIDALARCAELQASPDVDSSHKVERVVFDNDPEIGALRAHARFAAILAKAFGSPPATERGRR